MQIVHTKLATTQMMRELFRDGVRMPDQLFVEVYGYVPDERNGYADNTTSVQGRECT